MKKKTVLLNSNLLFYFYVSLYDSPTVIYHISDFV